MPKAEHVTDIAQVVASGAAMVLLLIETARGFSNMTTLASAPGVQRLLFGSIDFKLDLGIDGDRDALLLFRSQIVLASRLTGILSPVDGVTTAINDAQQLADDTSYARRLGFGGKLCIHPKQVGVVNQSFRPSATDVSWATRVLDAAAAAHGAAVALDGQMVDRPVILRAQKIMEQVATK